MKMSNSNQTKMNKKGKTMKIEYQKNINEQNKIFNLEFHANEQENLYKIICLSKENEEMGFVSFSIKENLVWILKLETNPKFARLGVASAIVDIMEYFAVNNGITRIEGKFYPDNQFARPFYEKNGFFVPNATKSWDDYDETWTLFKNLDKQQVDDKVSSNIKVFEDESENE